jgi:hypothetical protein
MALARPVQQFSLLPSLLNHSTSVHRQPSRHSVVPNSATKAAGITLPGSVGSLGEIGNLVAGQPLNIQELRVRDVQVGHNPRNYFNQVIRGLWDVTAAE